jgi:hypothetical protein
MSASVQYHAKVGDRGRYNCLGNGKIRWVTRGDYLKSIVESEGVFKRDKE